MIVIDARHMCIKCSNPLSKESDMGGISRFCSNKECERYGLLTAWNLEEKYIFEE